MKEYKPQKKKNALCKTEDKKNMEKKRKEKE